jgi:protein-disulfide isomerase
MICILALIVFGILGLFSAKYRVVAKEAFNCVFKKITLQKCDTGLDTRLKSQITGSMMRWWPAGGRTMYKYFQAFSWIFLILTLLTIYFMGQGIVFYLMYGNCNGPDSNQFCIFDPLGTNKPPSQSGEGSICAIPGHSQNKTLTAPQVGELTHGVYKGNLEASVVIIEFGCYSCHYTKKAEQTIKRIIGKYGDKVLYIYKDFPLSLTHPTANMAAQAAHCALEQDKYWEYRESLFGDQSRQLREDLISYADDLGLDIGEFEYCLESEKYLPLVEQNYNQGLESGITVTPTFFINGHPIVGAEEYSKFKEAIDKELGIQWWEFWK